MTQGRPTDIDPSTGRGLRKAMGAMGIGPRELSWWLATNERTMRRWIWDQKPVNPVAAQAVRWMLAGFRPTARENGPDICQPAAFREARATLGLKREQLSAILQVHAETIEKWETDGARGAPSVAGEVMQWMLDGFRPPDWPA
jgi:DNA-binding XRE family transcriptional regulator